MERPRKLGAKWTNSDIKPDEFVQEIDLDYDGKRDRWNGYDPSAHQKVIDQFQEVEEVRRKLREKELEEKMRKKAEQAEQGDDKELDIADLSSDDDDDEGDLEHLDNELKYAEQADMPGQKIDKKSRTTVRNLRLREDTGRWEWVSFAATLTMTLSPLHATSLVVAKYLRNLDVESAYYDPKTRSMRQNPNPDKAPEELQFAGDNFVRWSGDATQMAKMQVFAWQAYEKGVDVNLQADPTRAALLHKEYAKKADAVKDTARDSIIAKYGGEEHLKNAPPKELLLGQTEEYVEYSAAGKLVKGVEKAKARSKYDEDNYTKFGSGHTSVYGSFFDVDAKRWGYQCCRSTFRGSYCTGAAGIQAAADVPTSADNVARMEEVQRSQPASKTLKEMHLERLLGEGEAREAKRQRQ